MGTDSSVLFWIPRLCSPKRSLDVNWFDQYGSVESCFMQSLQLTKYTRYAFYNTGQQRKIPQNLSCSSDNQVPLIKLFREIFKFREDTSKNRFSKVP